MPTNDALSSDFRTFVAREMEKQGLSIRGLATRVGITHQTLNEILKADGPVKTSTVVDVSRALGFQPNVKFVKPRGGPNK